MVNKPILIRNTILGKPTYVFDNQVRWGVMEGKFRFNALLNWANKLEHMGVNYIYRLSIYFYRCSYKSIVTI